MKNLILFFTTLFVVSLGLFSCGGGGSDEATTDSTAVTVTDNQEVTNTVADFSAGKLVYEGVGKCVTCHQPTGVGAPPAFPPLAGADYLLADKMRAIKQAVKGSDTPITVNGQQYPGKIMGVTMATVTLTDQQVADVVNYVLNSWGNNGGVVTVEDVKATLAK